MSNDPTKRTLAFIGAEHDAAVGSLIHMLGGIDLMTLAKLEERGINSHAEAVHELKKMNEELYFYTPHHRITIKDQLSQVDGLVVVVKLSKTSDIPHVKDTLDRLENMAPFFVEKKVIIWARTADTFQWSEDAYNDLVQRLRAVLEGSEIGLGGIPVIPSDSSGGNIIEPSVNTSWYTQYTLACALDDMLS